MVVENGEGLNNADSFVDVEFADNYFLARNADWAEKEVSEKEKFLILATDYINSVFKWKGKKATQEQSLNFPRTDLIDSDGYKVEGIPLVLKQSVCEAVDVLVKGGSLFETSSEKGNIASESVSGAVSVSYFQGSKKEDVTLYQSINARLRGLFYDTSKKSVVISRVTK